jgi:hypothetical protein
MLTDDNGRVYREVKFRRLDGKKIWPKSPLLSGQPLIEPGAVEVLPELPEPERVEALEPTRPAEPKLLEPKARPTPESPQSERAKRYIKKNFPGGTKGITTAAIRRKLTKDKDLQAELEKENGPWGVPSATTINRVIGRRGQKPGRFWACPGMPNDAQTQAAHKALTFLQNSAPLRRLHRGRAKSCATSARRHGWSWKASFRLRPSLASLPSRRSRP